MPYNLYGRYTAYYFLLLWLGIVWKVGLITLNQSFQLSDDVIVGWLIVHFETVETLFLSISVWTDYCIVVVIIGVHEVDIIRVVPLKGHLLVPKVDVPTIQ